MFHLCPHSVCNSLYLSLSPFLHRFWARFFLLHTEMLITLPLHGNLCLPKLLIDSADHITSSATILKKATTPSSSWVAIIGIAKCSNDIVDTNVSHTQFNLMQYCVRGAIHVWPANYGHIGHLFYLIIQLYEWMNERTIILAIGYLLPEDG